MSRQAVAALTLTTLLLAPLAAGLQAAEAPEEVLAEETKAARTLVVEADGFVARMDTWHQWADTFDGLGKSIEQWKPIFAELRQIKQIGQLGLFDALAQIDPSLAFVEPLIDTIAQAEATLTRLSEISNRLVLLHSDLDVLLTNQTLTLEQMNALHSSIPGGIEAIETAAREYENARPAIDAAFQRLQELERELGSALGKMLPMLPGDASKQLAALVQSIFADLRNIKDGLDAMAANAERDVATLRALETALFEAQAHHAFALAEKLVEDGRYDDAERAFQVVVEQFAGTSWAEEAAARLDAGIGPELGDGLDAGDKTVWVVILTVLLLAMVGAAGFFVWRRRRQGAELTDA